MGVDGFLAQSRNGGTLVWESMFAALVSRFGIPQPDRGHHYASIESAEVMGTSDDEEDCHDHKEDL